jgi:hypothetical protein
MKSIILTYLFLFLLAYTTAALATISPSQVLVLYNADWTDDHPLTDPGQDSKEIAEHYVRMHTDRQNGEKPYILGLHCDHGTKILDEYKHLNSSHLEEDSKDNTSGVVLDDRSFFNDAIRDDQLRDSRQIEFVLPGGSKNWQRNTLQLVLEPEEGDDIVLVKDGNIMFRQKVTGNDTEQWTIRLNGKAFASRSLTMKASCVDTSGKEQHWQADYVDYIYVYLSRTGYDGKRDDQNFIEDAAEPVKAFLENTENARPDGTLLKDHILFIVVCYGLPRTAIAPYGIARGITNKINNFGSIIAFEQRLQLLYYNLDNVQSGEAKPYRYSTKGGFTNFYLRSPQAWPLYGREANPFVHPSTYGKALTPENFTPSTRFTKENRRQYQDKFLYFVSRIDAPDPLQARALIDRAVYASQYAGPTMGLLPGHEYPESKERTGPLKYSKSGQWLWNQGWHHLYYRYTSSNRLDFLRLNPGEGFLNDAPVYLPGGIGATVTSESGWNRKNSALFKYFRSGVTVTAGAAHVYNGAPHIHNKSWWDDTVLYPALMSGYTLGEALFANQLHIGWITTFVGDPLLRFSQAYKTSDHRLPVNPEHNVRFRTTCPSPGGQIGLWRDMDLVVNESIWQHHNGRCRDRLPGAVI